MSYQVLYRAWRPGTFSEICGQDAVVKTLRRQVTTGRIAHAYLFCGTRGTGKTTAAKVLSKAINCLNPHGRRSLRRMRGLPGRFRPKTAWTWWRSTPPPTTAWTRFAICAKRSSTLPTLAQVQGLYHRRGAHALHRRLQRPAQDPGGAAGPRRVHPGHHRAAASCPPPSFPAASASISIAFRADTIVEQHDGRAGRHRPFCRRGRAVRSGPGGGGRDARRHVR